MKPEKKETDPSTGNKTDNKGEKSRLRENIEAIVLAIILALFIRTFVLQAFKIPSKSMLETLQVGDHILVNKFIYGIKIPFTNKTLIPISNPDKGDIIVFKFPLDPSIDFIKRVVAVAGDKIEIRNKDVYVNDILQDQKSAIYTEYNFNLKRDYLAPQIVPENSLFVMGDNRDNSQDSRYWGFVDLSVVKGQAFIIYWSWNKEEPLLTLERVRWSRLGKLLK